MCRLLVLLWVLFSAFAGTHAIGQFLQPTGSDGSITVQPGDTIDIAWTGVAQYPVFSLGILSTTNKTISWFVVNSRARPTSYRWKADIESLGFDTSSSQLFQFFACNGSFAEGSAFTLGFKSAIFNIADTATSTTASSPSSATSSSIIASATSSTINGPSATSSTIQSSAVVSSSSSSLSTGAKAGIGVGIALGTIVVISVMIWLFVTRRRQSPQQKMSVVARNELEGAGFPVAHAHAGRYGYYNSKAPYEHGLSAIVHEAPMQNATRIQPIGSARHHGARPAELAG